MRLEAVVIANPASAALCVKSARNTTVANRMPSPAISSRVVSQRSQIPFGHSALVLASKRDAETLEKISCMDNKWY